MKRILFVLLCFFVFPVSLSLATPPVSINLAYDLAKGSLHIEAVHPSFNLEKSYVRLMNVYVNGTQVSTLNYYRQNDYNEFTDDVPVTAQIGDVIKVELFCSLGGDMSQELTVAKPAKDQSNQGAGADNTATVPTTNTATDTATNSTVDNSVNP